MDNFCPFMSTPDKKVKCDDDCILRSNKFCSLFEQVDLIQRISEDVAQIKKDLQEIKFSR